MGIVSVDSAITAGPASAAAASQDSAAAAAAFQRLLARGRTRRELKSREIRGTRASTNKSAAANQNAAAASVTSTVFHFRLLFMREKKCVFFICNTTSGHRGKNRSSGHAPLGLSVAEGEAAEVPAIKTSASLSEKSKRSFQ